MGASIKFEAVMAQANIIFPVTKLGSSLQKPKENASFAIEVSR